MALNELITAKVMLGQVRHNLQEVGLGHARFYVKSILGARAAIRDHDAEKYTDDSRYRLGDVIVDCYLARTAIGLGNAFAANLFLSRACDALDHVLEVEG